MVRVKKCILSPFCRMTTVLPPILGGLSKHLSLGHPYRTQIVRRWQGWLCGWSYAAYRPRHHARRPVARRRRPCLNPVVRDLGLPAVVDNVAAIALTDVISNDRP